MSPQYYVYRPGTPGPKVKHPTRDAAQTEAQRLAAKHPGTTFEILKVIGLSSTPVPTATTFWLDEADKPEPTPPALPSPTATPCLPSTSTPTNPPPSPTSNAAPKKPSANGPGRDSSKT